MTSIINLTNRITEKEEKTSRRDKYKKGLQKDIPRKNRMSPAISLQQPSELIEE